MPHMKSMRVGFIGLGQMGAPMAANLCKGGVPLLVCSHSGRQFADFEALGASTTRNLADFADCGLVFLCLPGTEAVRETLLGDKGLLRRLRPGSIVVDTSTISHKVTLEIAAALHDAGIGFVDAPISGMPARAADGTLTIMAAGDEKVLAAVMPYLQLMGKNILHVGATGNGQLTKLVNQLLLNCNCAAIAEVLPLAVSLGLDPALTVSIINSSTGRSHASEYFLSAALKGDYPGYPMTDAYKDMAQALEISAETCAPLPVVTAAVGTYQTALRKGMGELGKGAMIRIFEEVLGVKVRG